MATATSSGATFFIFSLILFHYSSTLTSACGSCKPTPTPTPTPTPKPKPKPLPPPPKAACPPPPATVSPPPPAKCPKDTLKLGVCADLLGLVNVVVGTPPSSKCCALISGLADAEAALCLCTAIKANVLGINLNVPVTLSLLLSACKKTVPPGFKC